MTSTPHQHVSGHHDGHHDGWSEPTGHAPARPEGHGSGHDHADMGGVNLMALSATLHCLTGCAIGEIAGLMIGTAIGLSTGWTVALAVSLAFLFGYTLSTLPLLKAGLGFGSALAVVFAADTLSVATMEVVDNVVMALIPGAMDAGLVNAVFWVSMMIALTAAFLAAYPVNRYLLGRGKGHALTHAYHGAPAAAGARLYIPTLSTTTLTAAIVAFMLGGLLVSIAVELGRGPDEDTGGGGGGGHALSSVTRHG